jgi:hypothetical protein
VFRQFLLIAVIDQVKILENPSSSYAYSVSGGTRTPTRGYRGFRVVVVVVVVVVVGVRVGERSDTMVTRTHLKAGVLD